jgi:hypothetical protein
MENKYPYIKQYIKFIKDENLEDTGFDKEVQDILKRYEERDLYKNIINQIFKLCLEEQSKSNAEVSRIHNGLLNPNVSLKNLALGCEYDIQKVLNKIIDIITEEDENK